MENHVGACGEQLRLFEAYMTAWPMHCKKCHGYGQITESYDPSPGRTSLSPGTIEDTYPCSCTERGLCPRCGGPGLTNEDEDRGEGVGYGPCTLCGWDYKDGGEPDWFCTCPYDPLPDLKKTDEALRDALTSIEDVFVAMPDLTLESDLKEEERATIVQMIEMCRNAQHNLRCAFMDAGALIGILQTRQRQQERK